MIPRERVSTALDHRKPDRVPIDLASCGPTGIHTAFMESKTRLWAKFRSATLWTSS